MVDRCLGVCVAQAETGDELVVLGNLKFLLDRTAPSREHTDCTRINAAGLGGKEECLKHEACVHRAPREHLLVDENEAHDGCVESGNIAAVRVVAPLIVAAFNAVCSVDQFRDFDLRGAKFLRVGLPNGKIAVRKFALEGGFNRCEALVVLDLQSLVETPHVFFTQAISTLPRCQCNAEGTSIGPAGGSRRVLENGIEDVERKLLIRL